MSEETPEYETTIIIGCPVSRAKQRRLGISRYVPPLGSTREICNVCRKKLFVSREQLAFVASHDADRIRFKCFVCAAGDLSKSDLSSLDARPGEFFFSDGTRAGPVPSENN